MKSRLTALFTALLLAGWFFSVQDAQAATVTVAPGPVVKPVSKQGPVAPLLLLNTGAVGRICLTSLAAGGQFDPSTCKPFTVPQDSVMGTPIELTPPTTKSRAWISQGDPSAFPHLVYVVYGWKMARSLPIKAFIPQGFTLGRTSFGKAGEGLQFVPNSKGGLVLTAPEQLAAMLKFRAEVRLAMIAALKDIGTVAHKSTRMASDCGGGDPLDNPALRIGAVPVANVDCGGDWGSDPGGLGGGFGDGGYSTSGSGFGDWGVPSTPWSLESFDDFADTMVQQDFAMFMADFAATQRDKLPKCAPFIQECHDSCSLVEKIENSGCGALGVAAGAFLNPSIGVTLTVYCGAKVEIATAQCNAICNKPTQFQCEN